MVERTELLPVDEVIIIESLPADENATGTELFDSINRQIDNQIFVIQLLIAQSKIDFIRILRSILKQVEDTGRVPTVHLEVHGSETGLVLSNLETVSWQELCDLFRPINFATRSGLVVTFAVCRGAFAWRGARIDLLSPFAFTIGSRDVITVNSLVRVFGDFYRRLLIDDEFSLSDYMREIRSMDNSNYEVVDRLVLFEQNYDLLFPIGNSNRSVTHYLEMRNLFFGLEDFPEQRTILFDRSAGDFPNLPALE